ncbi:hypothetical protein [Pseudomonas sp. KNUC1026]|uniref:hypothetical protein n=1 Tax=Pseudomonas sp. KNUC1026 TaxID=2893890 RepID=UPI001F44F3C5|nr:hypothetical protein [Pseudomonas sp. KNUC1026]UFH48274.1 hypothetical protein LN139_13980 [Pseudomonas sp. KNUC1026]
MTELVSGEAIRARGDGQRYLYYHVTDRAGNVGALSRPAALMVQATPIPRDLPPPSVPAASGTSPRQTLNPAQAVSGVEVQVPAKAVIYDDESIELLWGDSGEAGGWISPALPASTKPWAFEVPSTSIGAHQGKTLAVSYRVLPGGETPSVPLSLAVSRLSGGLPAPEIAQAQGRASLSLRNVPASGATLLLSRWPLIGTDQRVRLAIYGAFQSGGQAQEHVVVDWHAVTEAEVFNGLRQTIPKPVLQQFALNGFIKLRAYVSWDRGQSWPAQGSPNFPVFELQLLA